MGLRLSRLMLLQATVAPSNRLPVELMTRIFTLACDWPCPDDTNLDHATPRDTPFSEPNRQLMRLASVCRYWRWAALGAPFLWKHVDASHTRLASLFVERSRHQPLEIITVRMWSSGISKPITSFAVDAPGYSWHDDPDHSWDCLWGWLHRARSFRSKLDSKGDVVRVFTAWECNQFRYLETFEFLLLPDRYMPGWRPGGQLLGPTPSWKIPLLKNLRTNSSYLLHPFEGLKELVIAKNELEFSVSSLLDLLESAQHLEVLRILNAPWYDGSWTRDPVALPCLQYFEFDLGGLGSFDEGTAIQTLVSRLVLSPPQVRLRVAAKTFTPWISSAVDVKQLLMSWPAFQSIRYLSIHLSSSASFKGWETTYPSPDPADQKYDLTIDYSGYEDFWNWSWSRVVHLCPAGLLSALQWGHSGCPLVLQISTSQWVEILLPMVGLKTFDYNGVEMGDIALALLPSGADNQDDLICPGLQDVRMVSTIRSREVGWSAGVPKAVAHCVLARADCGAPLRRFHVDCSRRTFGPRNATNLEGVIAEVSFGCTLDKAFILP